MNIDFDNCILSIFFNKLTFNIINNKLYYFKTNVYIPFNRPIAKNI